MPSQERTSSSQARTQLLPPRVRLSVVVGVGDGPLRRQQLFLRLSRFFPKSKKPENLPNGGKNLNPSKVSDVGNASADYFPRAVANGLA